MLRRTLVATCAAAVSSSPAASAAVGEQQHFHDGSPGWTPTQRVYRDLMQECCRAYVGDRASLFWARHRIKVEIYKYASVSNSEDISQLVGISEEVAKFMGIHMAMDVERIKRHNEAMMGLSVSEAKKFRAEYLEKEAEHNSWCKQRIRGILDRRPTPPYPFC